ncbi:MAG: hypothetical protein M9900_15620 [Flavobacteriales bacterium]|nr:hypothetical protein [Flavobacteriales bacterium]
MCSGGLLAAQDNLWVSGSQLLDFNVPDNGATTVCPLPTGPTSTDYQGQPAQYAQNAQYDENGKLLFFVVDGAVYDHAGYLMADNDAATSCTDCLMKGIQEVSIVLVPGTCDKYYIISADTRSVGGSNSSLLAFSILDLSMGSRYHTGRKGAVLHQYELPPEFALLEARAGNVSGLPGVNGYASYIIKDGQAGILPGNNSSRYNNIQHTVLDGAMANGNKVLFIRTAAENCYALITPYGIGEALLLGSVHNSGADAKLFMIGGNAVAQGPDGKYRYAVSRSLSFVVGPADNQILELHEAHIGTSSVSISPIDLGINTNIYGSSNSTGRIRGLAFSPNGRYLYFTQAFAPHVGYIDVLDPALQVYDLGMQLGIPAANLAPFAQGQIRPNKTPDGLDDAIYLPSANGFGYIMNPDAPASASWHPGMSTTATLNGLPISMAAQSSSPSFTQYLMDMQNYRDQQIPSLALARCCRDNERIPEWSHRYEDVWTSTAANPWTPADNPFTSISCPPSPTLYSQHQIDSIYTVHGYLYFEENFVIKTGSRLYVKNMDWRFAPNARLIIEKGAFVRFDSCLVRGTIDSLGCIPRKWPGMELYGTPTAIQGQSAYPADQGRLVLNNTTVQDAVVGVTVGKKNQYGLVVGTGGILETNGSTFRNCRIGVNFYAYQNRLPNNNPIRNRSRFIRTTFTADANYIAPLDFALHAQLWKVDGIDFLGCTFENLRITETSSSQLGQGIRSLDAHFRVLPSCMDPLPTPPGGTCQNLMPSRCTGLDMGIRAANAVTARNFTVDYAEFSNNVCGVYANSVLNFEVHNSNFQVGSSKATSYTGQDDEQYWQGAHRGIYSFKSWGFLVDDNTLTNNPNATTTQLEGIVTGYSEAHNDVVFRNHASNLQTGFAGEGICADPSNRALIGLTYLCNTNSGNVNDIWDRRVTSDPSTFANQTIRTTQGSYSRPADNSFGQQAGGHLDLKNTNYPNNTLGYNWTLPSVPYEPIYYSTGVYPNNMDGSGNLIVRPANNCASRVLPPIPDPSPGPVALRGQYLGMAQAHKTAYGNTRYLYDQLIDGGSTDETVQEIQSTWPSEAWELRQALLDKSPYLSTDVLFEVVKKNIMPPAMVAEICIANPEATKKEGFLKWLQYESPCLMPQYLIDNIEASWETKTYRTTMEDNLAYQHQAMSQALDLVLASYHADTLVEQVDSIRATWQVLRTTSARYAEILTYLQQDNFDSAYAVMDRLPVEFKLKEKEISEKDRTKQFISIVQGYRNGGRSEADLNEGDLNALRALAADAYDRPAEWAQNILCFGYGECRPAPSGGDDNGGMKAMRKPVGASQATTPALSIFPNPATVFATFAYTLPRTPGTAWLAVRDITGRELARIPVAQAEGQAVWDTRAVAPGTYMVELVNDGVSLGTVKLVVKQ